MPHNLIVC